MLLSDLAGLTLLDKDTELLTESRGDNDPVLVADLAGLILAVEGVDKDAELLTEYRGDDDPALLLDVEGLTLGV